MLFNICLIQIALYLFVSPIIRIGLGDDVVNYSFAVALLFTFLFIVAGIKSKSNKNLPVSSENQLLISTNGAIIVSFWALLYIAISLRHGLMNRRIGTHEAAILFSEIPVVELIIFRAFELLFPLLISYLIIKIIKFKLSVPDKFLALSLVVALALSGVIFSRTHLLFILICTAVILQNSLNRGQFRKLLTFAVVAGVLMFVLVSAYRFTHDPPDNLSAFISDSILKRSDGLELISLLIEIYGYPLTGVNPSAITPPIISSIPFLPLADDLKASALTTVKSNILAFEFSSPLRDTNSFVIVDVYYWGGVIGLMLSAIFLGLITTKIDQKILISKSLLINSLLIASAGNIIIMEREFIGILIGMARDFIIFAVVLFIICKKPKIRTNISTPFNGALARR